MSCLFLQFHHQQILNWREKQIVGVEGKTNVKMVANVLLKHLLFMVKQAVYDVQEK